MFLSTFLYSLDVGALHVHFTLKFLHCKKPWVSGHGGLITSSMTWPCHLHESLSFSGHLSCEVEVMALSLSASCEDPVINASKASGGPKDLSLFPFLSSKANEEATNHRFMRISNHLKKWVQTGDNFAPGGHLTISEDIFGCHNRGGRELGCWRSIPR